MLILINGLCGRGRRARAPASRLGISYHRHLGESYAPEGGRHSAGF